MDLTIEVSPCSDQSDFLAAFAHLCCLIPYAEKVLYTVNIGGYDLPACIDIHASRFPEFQIICVSSLSHRKDSSSKAINIFVSHRMLNKHEQHRISRLFKFAGPLCIKSRIFIYHDSSLTLKSDPINSRIRNEPNSFPLFFKHYCRNFALSEIFVLLSLGYFGTAWFSLRYMIRYASRCSILAPQLSGGIYIINRNLSESGGLLYDSFFDAYNTIGRSSVRDKPFWAPIISPFFGGTGWAV